MSKMCPLCGSSIYRTNRRTFDRLISLIRPVRRYHCMALECGWVGNLPHVTRPRQDLHFQSMETPSTLR